MVPRMASTTTSLQHVRRALLLQHGLSTGTLGVDSSCRMCLGGVSRRRADSAAATAPYHPAVRLCQAPALQTQLVRPVTWALSPNTPLSRFFRVSGRFSVRKASLPCPCFASSLPLLPPPFPCLALLHLGERRAYRVARAPHLLIYLLVSLGWV